MTKKPSERIGHALERRRPAEPLNDVDAAFIRILDEHHAAIEALKAELAALRSGVARNTSFHGRRIK